ncbi:hypothetical protein N9K85_07020 [Flavobacteriaceae bacterium]|nr:hypothetical protein [Flavobacteriaceae bacterium]
MFLNIIPELIFYAVLIIGGLYIFAVVFDYFSVKRRISKRGHNYISLSDFKSIFDAFPFNKEKRYYHYFKILDPLTILLFDSLGYDLAKFKIGISTEDVLNELSKKYTNDHKLEGKELTKEEMTEFLNSDGFDFQTPWFRFPDMVFPAILDYPTHNEKQPLNLEDINKLKAQFKNEEIIKKIISYKAFTKHVSANILAINELIKSSGDDENRKNYLQLKLQMCNIYLDTIITYGNQTKRHVMQQYR